MNSPSHSVLILGCGSIGERHLRCFLKTGRVRAAVCDTNGSLLQEVSARYGVEGFESLAEAQTKFKTDAWVICTQAQTHLPLALKGLQENCHLLIEKPLAVEPALVPQVREAIARSAKHVAVAYVYHAMPWVQSARQALLDGVIGTPRHATIVTGQHFPTFRPAYRDIYYTRHETGGGAIQDALTHVANMTEWLLGPTERLYCDASHQMLAGVEVEDTVNVVARNNGVLVTYALNQFQAPNEMELKIHGDLGSLAIQGHLRRWGLQLRQDSDWRWFENPAMERDELFTGQAAQFLDGIEGKPSLLSTFEEGVRSLQFNIAALESARTGLAVHLPR